MDKWIIIYEYGSRVYGTHDECSDFDQIWVMSNHLASAPEHQEQGSDWNHTYYSEDRFRELIDVHDVSALECLFLPEGKVSKQGPCPHFQFHLDLGKLRRSFSAKASNSWVKAKKKIDVHQEYRLGRKSLFHALRILDFGIQIAEHGRIVDYSSANTIWEEIQIQGFKTWQEYKDAWQECYNNTRTSFRKLAPKE